MLTLIFIILFLVVFGKLLKLAIKAAWGAARVAFSLVLLPISLILLVIQGMTYIALPILVIVGLVVLLVC